MSPTFLASALASRRPSSVPSGVSTSQATSCCGSAGSHSMMRCGRPPSSRARPTTWPAAPYRLEGWKAGVVPAAELALCDGLGEQRLGELAELVHLHAAPVHHLGVGPAEVRVEVALLVAAVGEVLAAEDVRDPCEVVVD